MAVSVRPMISADTGAVLRIYQAGMVAGLASYETLAPPWESFNASRLTHHRFVAADESTVVGWVAVSQGSARPVYAGIVEHSVYVDPVAKRQGIGLRLLEAVIESTEAAGIWTIQSGVFPENSASRRLHEKAGFREIGIRHHPSRDQRPGGAWRDVVVIERRSACVYPTLI
jgi:phosphinothricin acetyltransferase